MRTTAALIDIEAVPTIARNPSTVQLLEQLSPSLHCRRRRLRLHWPEQPRHHSSDHSSDTLAAAIAHAAALSVGTAFSNRIAIVASFTIGRIYMTITALWDHASDTLATRVADRTTAGITT